jgi:pyruvate,water dikinase
MSADKLILPLAEIRPDDIALAGGKGCALSRLRREGLRVPRTAVITTRAYQHFIDAHGLRDRILLELNRKPFADMRWEEIWDAALRIRSLFLTLPVPADLERALGAALSGPLAGSATVVRSSAPQEDSAGASFAGIHESYVNVSGHIRIVEHVRKVWASLWSDGALLYRQELGLAPESSAMAVLVQEMILGDFSGVVFTVSPVHDGQSTIEAVPGLNQGLVDGIVEPERWIIDRKTGAVVAHTPAARSKIVVPAAQGVRVRDLPDEAPASATLSAQQVDTVIRLARQAEDIFGGPQDVEWTLRDEDVTLLQSRPVTTTAASAGDRRGWYLSLKRSFANLVELRTRIEEDLIPAMIREAEAMAADAIDMLPDAELAEEVRRRVDRNQHWSNIYWADFIPYAHGVRLFGQVYNDVVKPENPYEFTDVLTETPLASMARNRHLEELAAAVRLAPETVAALRQGSLEELPAALRDSLATFVARYGTLSSGVTGDLEGDLATSTLVNLILEMAERPPRRKRRPKTDRELLVQRFLDAVAPEERDWALSLIDLARSSYRLRDDDNIHLGRIEAQARRAVREAEKRLAGGREASDEKSLREAIALMPREKTPAEGRAVVTDGRKDVRARQLIGQPAGPGLARGRARVVSTPRDLKDFQNGEILICDAVDPNMTFIVPLAAAVVERRGGMLIHGAIIAREYGLPCVTGVPELMRFVCSGDLVTVDGYLGIIIIGATGGS